jgi:hypothetical protein
VDNITGKLGGEVLSKRQFQRLEQFLASHDVDLTRGLKSSFQVFEGDKNPVLRLRRNATRYETLHELGHFLHYKKIGKAEYLDLARQVGANIPEKTVFELIAKPSRWNRLNQLEQNHAWNYLRQYWGMDPTKSFFKWRQ